MSKSKQTVLWNRRKKGTLIIAAPRCGSHFLQDIVLETVKQAVTWDSDTHGQLFNANKEVIKPIEEIEQRPGYNIGIVNDWWAQLELSTRPDVMDRYHLIRIKHTDMMRWFMSWYFFLHHPDGQSKVFHHHNTTKKTYANFINNNEKLISFTKQNMYMISNQMAAHALVHAIPVDEELDFDDLPKLATEKTRWKPNHYPNVPLERLFEQAGQLKMIIQSWNIPIPGKFKTL